MSLPKSAGASANRGIAKIGKLLLERRIGGLALIVTFNLSTISLRGNCGQASDAVPQMGLVAGGKSRGKTRRG